MLSILKEKVDHMLEKIGSVSKEMTTFRKNQKEMLEIENTVIETKNAFDGLISKWDTPEERIGELEHISLEISQTEKQ